MDVPELNSPGEDEERSHKSHGILKSSTRWPEPWSWHTFSRDGRDDGGYGFLSLSRDRRWFFRKVMETLTLKGVFIGVPNGLKWLEPTMGLGHLI